MTRNFLYVDFVDHVRSLCACVQLHFVRFKAIIAICRMVLGLYG